MCHMSDPNYSLFLSRLNHDVRLKIYSYINLPPFDNCRDHAGLLLSCRQLKEEMDSEGTRQLRMYLDSIDKDPPVEFYASHRPNNLEFVPPLSVIRSPRVGVNVPFWLPPTEHDWHLQSYPSPGLCCTYPPHHPPFAWEIAERRRNKEEELYKHQINQLLKPIRLLHALRISIDVYLTVDKSTATRIAEDEMLGRKLDDSRLPPRLLGTTVLGRLLDCYITRLKDQGGYRMWSWSNDWAFNTETVNVTWDFTDPSSLTHERGQWYHGAPIRRSSISSQASCSEDRREGAVRVAFDVKEFAQNSLNETKRLVRTYKSMARLGGSTSIEQTINEWEAKLTEGKLKLQKLGIEEGEDPELNHIELRIAERIEARLNESSSA